MLIKKIDSQEARECVMQAIKNYQHRLDVTMIVLDALRPYDGKPYSRRMATAVEKALKAGMPASSRGWSVEWGKNDSAYHLLIWGNGIHLKNRLALLLGYPGPTKNVEDHTFDYARYLEEYAPPYTRMSEHIYDMQDKLSSLDELVLQWNSAVDALQQAEQAFGYAANYLIENR